MYPWYANIFLQLKADNYTPFDTIMYYEDNVDLDPVYKVEKDAQGKNKSVLSEYSGEGVLPLWEDRLAAFQKSQYRELIGNVLFDLCFQSKFLRGGLWFFQFIRSYKIFWLFSR